MKNLQSDRNNNFLIQHNHLIEAKYHLTLQEKRLMCWLASQVKQTDEDFKEHTLLIKDFANLVGIKGDHLYRELDTLTHKLMQKIITIKSLDNKDYTKATLLGGVKYYEGQGIVKLSFHPYLKPYMLQLKDRFTQISLGDIIGLKSVYSIRIYELLKQYETIGKREIFLDELRDYCGITSSKYKKFNDFKKDVLIRATNEINVKTDLFVSYQEIKESRKIISIEWTIKKQTQFEKTQCKKASVIQKELNFQNTLLIEIMEYGFSTQTAKKFLRQESEEVVRNALKAVNLQLERGNVKNPKAMFRTAIKDHWHPEVFKKK